ncbi:mannose-6-phosphate isomerase [Flavobacterium sediminis]|uniref:Phosphohexomutase n=1 Tax=Flavobacterium sediminis TaxID=2201181 RepID=A0A2U8QS47_9FLAO|nr:type I phosphomannose isomerase catalytic subunit [Flavobacterium sediminis]AWM12983.1 mannose-6-phosphate isomerase [Flavobacterium sediminis]
MKAYPIQFEAILKERIWGGTKLKDYLNKPIISEITGESWEISTVPGDISVVANGDLKGRNLNEIIADFPKEILGERVLENFGQQFPLLFKFIDAREDLSIQLHPNDELAKKRHNSFGKTEMWYVMQAEEQSRLVVGFKKASNQKEYVQHLENNSLLELLEEIPVKAGDVFFLETGTIHAIGSGVLIAEIQQTSDVTYRLYDWGRVDAEGKSRELHTELALEAINYELTPSKITYTANENQATELVHCPYFNTDALPVDGTVKWKSHEGSFTVFMCAEGKVTFTVEGVTYTYQKGDTVLIPAEISSIVIEGKATLLEIFL